MSFRNELLPHYEAHCSTSAMLQHIVKKNILLINRSIALGSRRAAGIGFGIPLTGEQLIRADAS